MARHATVLVRVDDMDAECVEAHRVVRFELDIEDEVTTGTLIATALEQAPPLDEWDVVL